MDREAHQNTGSLNSIFTVSFVNSALNSLVSEKGAVAAALLGHGTHVFSQLCS